MRRKIKSCWFLRCNFVCTQSCSDVFTMSITLRQRRMNVKTTLCVYWEVELLEKKITSLLGDFHVTFWSLFLSKSLTVSHCLRRRKRMWVQCPAEPKLCKSWCISNYNQPLSHFLKIRKLKPTFITLHSVTSQDFNGYFLFQGLIIFQSNFSPNYTLTKEIYEIKFFSWCQDLFKKRCFLQYLMTESDFSKKKRWWYSYWYSKTWW